MTLVVEFPPDVEQRLRTNAALHGKDINEYVTWLVEKDTAIDYSGVQDAAESRPWVKTRGCQKPTVQGT